MKFILNSKTIIKKKFDFGKKLFVNLLKKNNNSFFIVDKELLFFFKKKIIKILETWGVKYEYYILERGELDKSILTFKEIIRKMLNFKVKRNSLILSLGGGVCGDISGFISSVFLRGVNFIHIPTTIVSQVDSSIGSKNGINFISKNIIGTFYKPKLILISIFFLRRLNTFVYINGFSEIFKITIINNKKLFERIFNNIKLIKTRNYNFLNETIKESIKSKIELVKRDKKETKGIRVKLNLGHTFAHAIESCSNYKVSHGEAVWLGIYLSILFSRKLKLINKKYINKIVIFLKKMSCLNTKLIRKINTIEMIKKIYLDKKNYSYNYITFIFIKKIGNVICKVLRIEEFKKIFLSIKKKLFM